MDGGFFENGKVKGAADLFKICIYCYLGRGIDSGMKISIEVKNEKKIYEWKK